MQEYSSLLLSSPILFSPRIPRIFHYHLSLLKPSFFLQRDCKQNNRRKSSIIHSYVRTKPITNTNCPRTTPEMWEKCMLSKKGHTWEYGPKQKGTIVLFVFFLLPLLLAESFISYSITISKTLNTGNINIMSSWACHIKKATGNRKLVRITIIFFSGPKLVYLAGVKRIGNGEDVHLKSEEKKGRKDSTYRGFLIRTIPQVSKEAWRDLMRQRLRDDPFW